MRDQVFISYSHRDAAWLERLQVYLAPFERQGQVRRWDDTLIAPGERWAQEINEALASAKVAVLLVSAQFLASDFIARVELPRLLGAAEDQGVTILPLVLDWCNFERMPELAQFQSINPPSRPLEALSEIDCKAMLAKLAAAVADALQGVGGAEVSEAPVERGRFVGLPARNPLFTGRRDLLDALASSFAGGGRAALCGLAGIGKTEAAIEFAHRERNRYAWVLWSRAESVQPLVRGFCAMAAALGLPEAKGSDQLATAQAARRALASRSDWLLLLDSADDLAVVRDWLPEGDNGCVIITSRSAALGGLAQAFELEPLDDDSAARFLLRRARLAAADGAADAALMNPAIEIAHLAGGLPLALEQAGSYIEETGCSLEEYSELWCKHRSELLAARGETGLRDGVSLIDAWEISLGELQRANPSAVALLRLLAFFHCDALPDTPLADGRGVRRPGTGPGAGRWSRAQRGATAMRSVSRSSAATSRRGSAGCIGWCRRCCATPCRIRNASVGACARSRCSMRRCPSRDSSNGRNATSWLPMHWRYSIMRSPWRSRPVPVHGWLARWPPIWVSADAIPKPCRWPNARWRRAASRRMSRRATWRVPTPSADRSNWAPAGLPKRDRGWMPPPRPCVRAVRASNWRG